MMPVAARWRVTPDHIRLRNASHHIVHMTCTAYLTAARYRRTARGVAAYVVRHWSQYCGAGWLNILVDCDSVLRLSEAVSCDGPSIALQRVRSHQESPEARINEFFFENSLYLLQNELLNLANIFEDLLAFFRLPHLAFDLDLFK